MIVTGRDETFFSFFKELIFASLVLSNNKQTKNKTEEKVENEHPWWLNLAMETFEILNFSPISGIRRKSL